jgi:hypothetical protein
MLIGAVLSAARELADMGTGQFIQVYDKRENTWRLRQSIPLSLDFSSPPALRAMLRTTIEELGECKTIAATAVGGVAYQMFDRHGFAIFEAAAFSPELLDKIAEDVAKAGAAKETETISAAPLETDLPGHYFLNLIKLQAAYPAISSKQALQDFLRQPFSELTLVCSHIPPWLAALESIKYHSSKKAGAEGEEEIQMTIVKSC